MNQLKVVFYQSKKCLEYNINKFLICARIPFIKMDPIY